MLTKNELEILEKSMSQEEIMAYAKKIKPIARGIDINNLDTTSTDDLPAFWVESKRIHGEGFSFGYEPIAPASGLKEIARVTTYHSYGGYYGCLRPSVDECIVQCPKDILDKVCAFQVYHPTLLFRECYNTELDRHILTTIYYTGTLPEDIASKPVEW